MQRIKIPLLAICLVLATTRAALAFTAPSAGDMWYTMYEVFYDRLARLADCLPAAFWPGGWPLPSGARSPRLSCVPAQRASSSSWKMW